MSFQLYLLGDTFQQPLYFTMEGSLVTEKEKDPLFALQFRLVVKFNFSQNSYVYVNPFTGYLLCSMEGVNNKKTRTILDDTTFFNNSIKISYHFLPVESKNFRIIWCNLALKHIYTLEPKVFTKMNYDMKDGIFYHYSKQYLEQERKTLMTNEKKLLEKIGNPILGKKCIITIGASVCDKQLLYFHSSHQTILSNGDQYYEIDKERYLELFTLIQYLNNIGFLYFTNVDTIYINSFKDIELCLEEPIHQQVSKELLGYCVDKGINFILHENTFNKESCDLDDYQKNITFIWSSMDTIQLFMKQQIYSIDKVKTYLEPFIYTSLYNNWVITAKEIFNKEPMVLNLNDQKYIFSLFYNDTNVINPISRFNMISSKENIIPEFILALLMKMSSGEESVLSDIFQNDILDFNIDSNEFCKFLI